MKVLFNNSLFFHQTYGGVTRYSVYLAKKLIEKKIDIMGDKIKLEIDEDQREHNLEVLSSFHWTLRKIFLKQ